MSPCGAVCHILSSHKSHPLMQEYLTWFDSRLLWHYPLKDFDISLQPEVQVLDLRIIEFPYLFLWGSLIGFYPKLNHLQVIHAKKCILHYQKLSVWTFFNCDLLVRMLSIVWFSHFSKNFFITKLLDTQQSNIQIPCKFFSSYPYPPWIATKATDNWLTCPFKSVEQGS